MKEITKTTPLALICLLGGGAALFGLNAFFPVPIETFFAVAGMVVFVAGLLFGLVAVFRSIGTLTNSESRRVAGIRFPIQTILIVVGIFVVVTTTAIQVKRSMDQREESQHHPPCQCRMLLRP